MDEAGRAGESGATAAIAVRRAEAGDLPFALSLAPRLVEFGMPPWRDPDAVLGTTEALLREVLTATGGQRAEASTVLVAHAGDGTRLGFVQVEEARDFFSGKPQAYIANLAVAAEAEGRAVGRALIAAAEEWALERGLDVLTLYVFAGNSAARAFYARTGFAEDSLKLVRQLGRR